MACYHPIRCYFAKELNPSGKRSLVFNSRDALAPDDPVDICCGQCIGCRLQRSARWAGRCVAESQMHKHNSFITLTYSPENLPQSGSLVLDHFQRFMKRLRKHFFFPIRFFHCGEYGEKFGRPHYHACLFGVSFPDKVLWKIHNDESYYISKTLENIWGLGFCVIGDVSFESAAYVARYITKKITGDKAFEHYTKFDLDTGEVLKERKPEYCTMSRRPGIGFEWFKKFSSDLFPFDEFIVNGRNVTVPKYFDNLLLKDDPYMFDAVKEARILRGKAVAWDNTFERRLTKEYCKLRSLDNLKRAYEIDNSEIIRF